MDKLAAYELLLEEHPLWNKEANTTGPLLLGGLGTAAAGLGAVGGALGAEEGDRARAAIMEGIPAGSLGAMATWPLASRLPSYPAALGLTGLGALAGGYLGTRASTRLRNDLDYGWGPRK